MAIKDNSKNHKTAQFGKGNQEPQMTTVSSEPYTKGRQASQKDEPRAPLLEGKHAFSGVQSNLVR